MPLKLISGDPGTAWTNDTGKIQWQLHVNFRNSCGVCIGQANLIGPYWPIPFHFGCLCRQVPIAPGETADPFVDYIQELEKLGPSQQRAAVGASNWAIFRAGLVTWDDIVTRARVRDFREVVDRAGLKLDQLTGAGVTRGQADRALGATNTPAHASAASVRKEAVAALRQHGLSDAEIARQVGSRIAARVGIAGGPSGPSKVAVPRGPVAPTAPAKAALAAALARAPAVEYSTQGVPKDRERLLEGHEKFKAEWEGQAGEIPPDEAMALATYKGAGHERINGELRRGETPPEAAPLDALIGRAKLGEDAVVYRGVGAGTFDEPPRAGDAIPDAGFLSTSLNWQKSLAHANDALIRILVPKGTNYAYMDAAEADGGEFELLLPRGGRVEVLRRLPDTEGVPTYEATYGPPKRRE